MHHKVKYVAVVGVNFLFTYCSNGCVCGNICVTNFSIISNWSKQFQNKECYQVEYTMSVLYEEVMKLNFLQNE